MAGELDNIDKPRHLRGTRGEGWHAKSGNLSETIGVPAGDALASREQVVDPRELRHAQRRTQLTQPVVVAETIVPEPRGHRVAALVAQRPEACRPIVVAGDDHP